MTLLNGNCRAFTDPAGERWLVWETVTRSGAIQGAHALRPSPWITFTNQRTGARLSGFAAVPLADMSDEQLARLLEEMERRDGR